ncbi:hypothetical protein Goshw_028226, partial [Gossypium schwendimanii]|nr:hypothetical protein [Gossypium schwendimanii]
SSSSISEEFRQIPHPSQVSSHLSLTATVGVADIVAVKVAAVAKVVDVVAAAKQTAFGSSKPVFLLVTPFSSVFT